jgi:hypothetical protein
MSRHGTFVRVDTHEQLTRFGELHDEFSVMRNELLHGFSVAEVAQVAEYRHETLGFEWEGVDIEGAASVWGIYDMLVNDLVGEERCDNGKEP